MKVKDDIIGLGLLTRNCCVCVKLVFQPSLTSGGKYNPAERNPSTGLVVGSSVNLELAPYRSLGNTPQHLEPLKVSCWKVLSGVSAPCTVDSHGGRGPALSSSRENKVFYSLRLRLRFKTKVWKQNQMRVIVLLSILNR